MSGSRNGLLRPDVAPYAAPDNPLAPQPTWADAAQWHGQNLADTWSAMQDPQFWVNAARQYGNALLMGTTAPRAPLRVFHGSLADFEAFDPAKVGSGPLGERYAAGAKHADEYYLTTNPKHAESYGSVVQEYQIDRPLFQKDAKGELDAWARSEGYDNAQQHLDEYYDGNIYQALDLDNYLKDALSEAKAAGFPGVHVQLGDLKGKVGDRKAPIGDFVVIHDPSVATKIGSRRDF